MTTDQHDETVTLWAVVFTDDDEMTTGHSAHLSQDDAQRAGATLARTRWKEIEGAGPFPDVDNDNQAMDALRTELDVHLEVEPIRINADVIRAIATDLAAPGK